MQNRNLIFGLIAVQFLLIAFLLFKVLGNSATDAIEPTTPETPIPVNVPTSEGSGLRVAFINNDSLIAGYDYQQELRESLEKQARVLEADLQRKSRVFEENYTLLEQEAPNMSQEELQYAQADLMQKQQELVQYRDEKAQELAEEEARLTNELMKDLNGVLKNLKEEENIDLIFTLSPASSLLFADERFDITPTVIQRLNEGYAARQQAK
jgi:outer membrane protein